MADGKSCKDSNTDKKTLNTVDGCAKACSGTSTVFVYAKMYKSCYCISGATSEGECRSPYDNWYYNIYRYNGRLWYAACVILK